MYLLAKFKSNILKHNEPEYFAIAWCYLNNYADKDLKFVKLVKNIFLPFVIVSFFTIICILAACLFHNIGIFNVIITEN